MSGGTAAGEGESGDEVLRLFDPVETAELLRGWQLHVLRRRAIHETSARWLERASHWLTVPTTIFAALAGTSAFAAGQADGANSTLAVAGLAVGIGAALTSHLQSTLNLSMKAEGHRQAASSYKQLLRTFERLTPDISNLPAIGTDDEVAATLKDLEARIADVDGMAPIAPQRIARREEHKRVVIVTEATGLVG